MKQIKNNPIYWIIFLILITRLKRSQKKTRKEKVMFLIVKEVFRELAINAFKRGLFPLKSTTGTGLTILTPKQILQRLLIALAQLKVGNHSESL